MHLFYVAVLLVFSLTPMCIAAGTQADYDKELFRVFGRETTNILADLHFERFIDRGEDVRMLLEPELKKPGLTESNT